MRASLLLPLLVIVVINLIVHLEQIVHSRSIDASHQNPFSFALETALSSSPAAPTAAHAIADAAGGTIILTFVCGKQKIEAANFVGHLREAGLMHLLHAVALDDTSASACFHRHGLCRYCCHRC